VLSTGATNTSFAPFRISSRRLTCDLESGPHRGPGQTVGLFVSSDSDSMYATVEPNRVLSRFLSDCALAK